MLRRRAVRSIQFRHALPPTPETSFPRAVIGEDFDRYARAMRRQAHRWMELQWARISTSGRSMHDIRDIMRWTASMELGRPLSAAEEQLLSAELHETWAARDRDLPDILPYWSTPTSTPPARPTPAA